MLDMNNFCKLSRQTLFGLFLFIFVLSGCNSDTNRASDTASVQNETAVPVATMEGQTQSDAVELSPTQELPHSSTPRPKNPTIYGFGDNPGVFDGSNKIAPEDIIEEVRFGMGGGGEIVAVCAVEDSVPKPQEDLGTFEMSIHMSESRGVYFTGGFPFFSCGWNQDDLVEIVLEFPDGRWVTDSRTPLFDELSGQNYVHWSYDLFPTDPMGEYRIILKSELHQSILSANIVPPSGPRLEVLYSYQADGMGDDVGLFLYRFRPGERVRVIAYNMTDHDDELFGEFSGWDEYTVDSDGNLYIDVVTLADGFAVIGDISGEVFTEHSPILEDSILLQN